jgi:hypothetical protein
VFIGNGTSRNITSQGTGAVNLADTCFFGVTTHTETCGTITALNEQVSYGASGQMPAHTLPLTKMDLGTGKSCKGDSGSPVYQKASGGDASLIGILSGITLDIDPNCGHTMFFTPIATALSMSSTSLILTPGLNLPPPQSVSTPFAQLMVSPDFTYDSRGEVVAVDPSGTMVAYRTTTTGSLYGMTPPGQFSPNAWNDYRVLAAGDWNGNGISGDFIAIDSSGNMYLYSGAGGGRLTSGRTQIGSGWGSFDPVVAGDVNGDGNSDIIARNTSTGLLYLYPGNGSGGFNAQSQIGSGWTTFKPYAAGDMNSDGKRDLLSINSAGQLFFYPGDGSGSFPTRTQIGGGWTGWTVATAGVSLDAGSTPDIVGRNSERKLFLYTGTGAGTISGAGAQIGGGF